jgi:hypothetical protein
MTANTCCVCTESRPGTWPRWFKGFHCRRCHSSWTGRQAAHTICCHRTFSSNSAADGHLVLGVCTDPAELDRFVLVTRTDGNSYWSPRPTPHGGGQLAAEATSS